MSAQTGTSPADTPKVISVDLALRGAVALLLTLLLSVSGWMLYRLIDHGERIGRLEELSLRDLSDRGELLSELRGLRTMLGQMQANQSEFRIEIKNLKDLLSAHERSERDK